MNELAKREEGFTIVEVLVAALILVLGALATFGVLAAATVNTQRSQGTQVALNRAQQEIEVLRSESDEELALTALPPSSADEKSPDYRVRNNEFAIMRGPPPSEYKDLVYEGGPRYGGGTIPKGNVNPGPTSFTSGNIKGQIYRYIVWRNDPNCSEETCPGKQDYKQIVVAVKLEKLGNEASERGYVEIQSAFVDPEHSAADNPIPGAEGVVTAQQFFLSDTPCSASGETIRGEIGSDHELHNTLGTCASGLKMGAEGAENGAPDALLLGPPPDPAPEDATNPALYDYSNDYVNTSKLTPETAKGLQIRREETASCNYTPKESSPQWHVHRWVTDPMPFNFNMTSGEGLGKVTIDFFTRALSDSQYTGKICIYLFDRHEEGSPPKATDTWLTNREGGLPYWTWTPTKGNGQWPRSEWAEELLTMRFNGPKTISKDDRLGVALSVDASTGGDGIVFAYDHPTYRTRIEVDTTTPLEGG
jgi:type II secretory pathway pseudopilin PulG